MRRLMEKKYLARMIEKSNVEIKNLTIELDRLIQLSCRKLTNKSKLHRKIVEVKKKQADAKSYKDTIEKLLNPVHQQQAEPSIQR